MPKGEMDKMGMGMMGQMDKMREMDSMKAAAMSGTAGCCMGMDMHKGEMGMPPDGMKMPQGMMMQGMSGVSSGSNMASGAGTTTSADTMNMGANARTSPLVPPRSMSAVPGVPGASHLYHIGATGFFLDQPHVTLTGQQQSALNVIKERALLDRANSDRRIEQGEQELWTLTAADQPDAAGIQAKVREIEQLRTNQRLAFIQNIGEATKVLTLEQRTQLLGMVGMSAK
jgi:Spy/CpxP family protein refolding chaperone